MPAARRAATRSPSGLSYLAAALIPLWPYAAAAHGARAHHELVCTFVALFTLGVVKGRIARQPRGDAPACRSSLIGSASAGVGFAIGHLVTAIVW